MNGEKNYIACENFIENFMRITNFYPSTNCILKVQKVTVMYEHFVNLTMEEKT